MDNLADFFGISFETGYLLFADEFQNLPGVFVVYTAQTCLDICITENLSSSIETHVHTKKWLDNSQGQDIYVAFHLDEDPESRLDKELYLRAKMNPICETLNIVAVA